MVLIINKNVKKVEFDSFLKKREKTIEKKFDAKKYSGVIKSFKNINPTDIQENLRNEW